MIKQVPRLVALMRIPDGADKKILQAALRAAAEALKGRIGSENVSIRIAVRVEDDPLSGLMAQRGKAASIDSVFEATLAEGQSPYDLIPCADGLMSHFEGLVEPASSALLAGTAHLIIEGTGNVFIALAARRDPGISVGDMRRWWLEQHAPLVKRIVRPQSNSYEQLHVDRDLSRRASEAAGFVFEPYDLFDTVTYDVVSDFVQVLSNEEISRQLYEDEIGHIDHPSFRGSVCRMV